LPVKPFTGRKNLNAKKVGKSNKAKLNQRAEEKFQLSFLIQAKFWGKNNKKIQATPKELTKGRW